MLLSRPGCSDEDGPEPTFGSGAANGRSEPRLTDAAGRTNVSFGEKRLRVKLKEVEANVGFIMGFSQPTPELPVPDVQTAQEYYRDRLGFEIGWHNEAGKIGAVSHGDCSIFFREVVERIPPSTFWVFCEDLEAAQADLVQRGANITDELELKPWGLRQFTVEDHCANKFFFFHDV